MAVTVVRLGTKRTLGEGLRLGTVRRPPRGVPKNRFALDDWYDVWFPTLAPSVPTMKLGLAADSAAKRATFQRKFRAEMAKPEPSHALDLLAALSHQSDFAIGCYCEDESTCHRAVLRALLVARGAQIRK